MYYTRKGDKGTSKLFSSKERIPKGEQIFEVLGSLDETNSFTGLCSVYANESYKEIVDDLKKVQNDLFICQAHFADSEIKIPVDFVSRLEDSIAKITKKIKPRESFVVPGGSRLSASLDVARTLARRTEREALRLTDKDKKRIDSQVFIYLNRLSSFFYVSARLANDLAEYKENPPKY